MSSDGANNNDLEQLEENPENASILSIDKSSIPKHVEHHKHVDLKLKLVELKQEEPTLSPAESVKKFVGSLQHILEKNNRSNEEAWVLYDQIKDFSFFDKVLPDKKEPESILRVVKALKYRKIKAGRSVYVEGDLSNGNIYILFSGELLVMNKKPDATVEAISPSKRNAIAGQFTFSEVNPSQLLKQGTLEEQVVENEEQVVYEKKKTRVQKTMRAKGGPRKNSIMPNNNEIIQNEEGGSPGSMSPSHKDDSKLFDYSPQELIIRKLRKEKGRAEKETEKEVNLYGYVRDKIAKGEHFGQQAVGPEIKMDSSVVASMDSELLVLAAATFDSLKNEVNNKVRKILDLIVEHLPGLEVIKARAIVKSHLSLFEEREFTLGSHITNEGEKGDYFYIMYEGSCEVYRTVKIEETETLASSYVKIKNFFSQQYAVKEKISLAVLKEGVLIGDEILFNENSCYSYSTQVVTTTCKILSIKKEKINSRFPKDVVKLMRQAYEEKKIFKEELFCQALEKRDVNFARENINQHFLVVKRNPSQEFTNASVKINTSPPQFTSLKKFTETFANDEAAANNDQSVSLPKLAKPKPAETWEPEEIQLKHKMLPFSRATLMPPKDIEKESPKVEHHFEKKHFDKLPYLFSYIPTPEKSILTESAENPFNVDHIRKAKLSLGYQDINEVYDDMSAKLNLDIEFKEIKANVNNADYFKLDFGRPYIFEERWLANAKSRVLRKEKSQPELDESPTSPLFTSSFPFNSQIYHEFNGSASSVIKLHSMLKDLHLDRQAPISPGVKINSEAEAKSPIKLEHLSTEPESSTLITLQTSASLQKKFEPKFLKDFNTPKKARRNVNKSVEGFGTESPKNDVILRKIKMRSPRSMHQPPKFDVKPKKEQPQQQEDSSNFGLIPVQLDQRDQVVDLKKSFPPFKPMHTPPLPIIRGNYNRLKSKLFNP